VGMLTGISATPTSVPALVPVRRACGGEYLTELRTLARSRVPLSSAAILGEKIMNGKWIVYTPVSNGWGMIEIVKFVLPHEVA